MQLLFEIMLFCGNADPKIQKIKLIQLKILTFKTQREQGDSMWSSGGATSNIEQLIYLIKYFNFQNTQRARRLNVK